MRRSGRSVFAVVSLLLLGVCLGPGVAAVEAEGSAGAAQEPPGRAELAGQDLSERLRTAEAPPPESVAEELARLNRTLTRIAELLERQTEGQRLDLALKRLEVESERVTALEEELRRTRSTKQSLEDEQFRIRALVESMAAQSESAPGDASVEELEALEQQVAQAQRMLERFQDQVADAERRILEIENELTRRRGDLRALQDRLDRELEGM